MVFEALISNLNFHTRIQPIVQRFHEHHVPHIFYPYGVWTHSLSPSYSIQSQQCLSTE